MTSSRVSHKPSGDKGIYSRFIPAKTGAELFREGAPLSACETKNQVNEWLAAESAAIGAYLAEEAAKATKREAFIAQVQESNRRLQIAESKERMNADLRRSLAYLDCCRLEGMPAAYACAVLC